MGRHPTTARYEGTFPPEIRLIAMLSLLQDVRYGLRGIRASIGFSSLAMVTLALGIGAATTMFSVIENVLVAPFPYRDADRIAAFDIHNLDDARPGGRQVLKPAEYLEFRTQNHVFSQDIGGGNSDVLWTTREGTEQFDGAYVTPNTFDFLGVPALLGRTITAEDAKPTAPAVFVMSYKMWQRRFHRDPAVLGRTFVLDGKPATLIGIMPKRFTKRGADLWQPAELNPTDDERWFIFQARLKPGVTLKQAEADLLPIAQRWAKDHPKDYPKHFTIEVRGYADSIVGSFKKTLFTLGAAVALLLLIACVNVANMLLARATARDREMAIRAALGASRWRVAQQLLVESLMLGVGGAVLGAAMAYAGIKALVAYIPDGTIPQEAEIGLNTPVLLFSLSLAVATALLFGLAPALQQSKRSIVEPLKDSGRGVSGGFRRGRLRNALVVVEMALSLVLLTGAGLMIRTFVALQQVDLGFSPDKILVARLPFPRGQYKTAAEKQRFFGQLLPRIKALHGVVEATETSTLPPYGGIRTEVEIPGKTHSEKWEGIYQLVSEGYFRTLGARLLRGRLLDEGEVTGARKVAVINQMLAVKYFGHEDPIGRQIQVKNLASIPNSPVSNPLFEIVGVLGDMKNQGLQEPVQPEILIPYTVTGNFERGILVRTAGNPMPLLDPVRREIWAVDHNVALTMTRTLEDFLSDFSYSQPRFVLLVLGVFAGIGLALVAIGVYSVIAYTVARQTREIGIRMALGAGRANVIRMVLRMGLWLIAAGLTVGLGASLVVNKVIASELWNVSPRDPATFLAVGLAVLVAGIAACWFPAMRATRVDPMVALRFE
jgi:putative ABC transport system permease protein